LVALADPLEINALLPVLFKILLSKIGPYT
jgi:hypothetical protein